MQTAWCQTITTDGSSNSKVCLEQYPASERSRKPNTMLFNDDCCRESARQVIFQS